MTSPFAPRRAFAFICLLILACGGGEPAQLSNETDRESAEVHLDTHAVVPPDANPGNPPAQVREPLHPRERYDWSRAPYALGFDAEDAPFLLDARCLRGEKPHLGCRKRLTVEVRDRTRQVHLEVVRALGVQGTDPRLWRFLSTRSSTETSGNGSQRPLDNQGTVHRLDVGAAWRAGARRAGVYEEAGNPLASGSSRRFWLGYGPQGQISWLFLDDWDLLGDPRMLADTVISDLTYIRVARRQHTLLTKGHIQCYEYDDVGKRMVTGFNGRKYQVGQHAVHEEPFQACVAEGPERRKSGKRETEKQLDRRCRLKNRVPYQWRPGLEQPANTRPIPVLDWWNLKRAIGGRPCPPWAKDEYEAHKRDKWANHSRRYGFLEDSRKRVRDRDLGAEPEGDQYDLWRSIWSAIVLELDGEELDWESLEGHSVRTVAVDGPSKEKLEQDRLLARDPNALDRRFRKKSKPED